MLTVVIVADFVIASLLLWIATFNRLDRFGFDVSCVGAPNPVDIAVDEDPLQCVRRTSTIVTLASRISPVTSDRECRHLKARFHR